MIQTFLLSNENNAGAMTAQNVVVKCVPVMQNQIEQESISASMLKRRVFQEQKNGIISILNSSKKWLKAKRNGIVLKKAWLLEILLLKRNGEDSIAKQKKWNGMNGSNKSTIMILSSIPKFEPRTILGLRGKEPVVVISRQKTGFSWSNSLAESAFLVAKRKS